MNIYFIVIASAVVWSTLGTIVYYIIQTVIDMGDNDLALFGAIFAPLSITIIVGYMIGVAIILIIRGLISGFIICLEKINISSQIMRIVKGNEND